MFINDTQLVDEILANTLPGQYYISGRPRRYFNIISDAYIYAIVSAYVNQESVTVYASYTDEPVRLFVPGLDSLAGKCLILMARDDSDENIRVYLEQSRKAAIEYCHRQAVLHDGRIKFWLYNVDEVAQAIAGDTRQYCPQL
jgi:hypothetical protein